MRLFLIGWAVLLVLGAAGLIARSSDHASPTNSAPTPAAATETIVPQAATDELRRKLNEKTTATTSPRPTTFFAAHPWPDLERLGTETYEIAAALVNKGNRFYCPRVTGVFALGTDERGWNRAKVVCIFEGTPAYERSFDISGHPTTGETIVRPGRPIMPL